MQRFPRTRMKPTRDATWWPSSPAYCGLAEVGPWFPLGSPWRFPKATAVLSYLEAGLAAKHGVTCINSPGLIDAGYRGEVMIALVNLDPATDYEVHKGDRIAQLVVLPVPRADFRMVEELPPAQRGAGGLRK